jgi:hypothetical protein
VRFKEVVPAVADDDPVQVRQTRRGRFLLLEGSAYVQVSGEQQHGVTGDHVAPEAVSKIQSRDGAAKLRHRKVVAHPGERAGRLPPNLRQSRVADP